MKNFLQKSPVWRLIVAIFTLSLYAHVAEAKGIATIFTIIAVVILAVVFVGFWALGWFAVSAATGLAPTVGATIVAYAAGAAATAGLVGMAVGQIQCLAGQDNMFFTGCNPTTGEWAGQQAGAGSPVMSNESYTATCNSISLTYDVSNANQYGIYRDGALIAQGNAQGLSKITYTDSNLTPHTTYGYALVMTDNQGQQFQYPVISGYTKCLPQCTFGADKSQVVFPAQVTLSWNCQDATSCSVSPTVGSVNAAAGQVTVSPAETTNYILTCQNIDGSTSFSSSINVTNPHLKEIKP